MVKCSFCNKHIEEGTGTLFIHRNGKKSYFCSTKCEKNMLKLNRKPSKFKWASN